MEFPGARYRIHTLGCKANTVDSQLIEAELQRQGWKAAADATPDEEILLCVVNSCTVTDEADRQSRAMASRLAKKNPHARVLVTGCSAEIDPDRLLQSDAIHYVVGNRSKPEIVRLILEEFRKKDESGTARRVLGASSGYDELRSRHPMDREWPAPDAAFMSTHQDSGEASRTRAFLKIQEGCNSFCTYCIIPYGRGPSRSLAIQELTSQVRTLVADGVREIVLTGTNIGDYGTDWSGKPELHSLISEILEKTTLERLRVSSLDPVEITPEILTVMRENPRFCPHFHVSLQSPSSRILKLMKRKYDFEDVQACLKSLATVPAGPGGPFVGMDLITGFPGETDADFEWALESLKALPWSRLHVFPYSERAGTPATRLPGAVPKAERQRRGRVLRELSLERLRAQYGTLLEQARASGARLEGILVEGATRGPDGGSWMGGYTANYFRVLLPHDAPLKNRIVSARISSLIVDPNAGDAAFLASEAQTTE